MNELSPREIVEVPMRAGHDEAGGYGGWRAAGPGAVGVHVADLVGAIVRLQLEQAAAERSEPPAVGADHPTRKRSDWNTDQRRGLKLVDLVAVGHDRRGPQRLDLVTE